MIGRIHAVALLVAAFGVAFALLPHRSSALTLIPPSFERDDVKPGEVITTVVKIFNERAETGEFYSSTANFKAKDETGTPAFAPETDVVDLAKWISIAPGPFALQPGERKEIPVEIKVPENAEPGGHYAGIFFSTQPPTVGEGSQIAIAAKVGLLVLLRVQGVINETASIATFAAVPDKGTFSRLPIDFAVRIQNSGNVHVRPIGSVTVRNMLGGTSAVLPVNSGQGAVLPQSIRKFDAQWNRMNSEDGTGNFFQEISREWKNFGLGSYTANLVLAYGQSNDKTMSATVTFWVLPWRVLTLSIIVIILVIWLIGFSVKRYNRWIVKKASQNQTPKK